MGYDYVEMDVDNCYVQDLVGIIKDIFYDGDEKKATEMQAYIFKIIGSSLLGNYRQKFYIWTGIGCKMKDFLITLIHDSFGEYAKTMDISHLTGKISGKSSEFLTDLKGVLFVDTHMSENHIKKTKLNTSIVKSLIGRDRIVVRSNDHDQFVFIP